MARLFELLFITSVACVNGAMLAAAPAASERITVRDEAPTIERIEVGSSHLELQFPAGFDEAGRREASAWILRSARAVAGYFDRFPVTETTILVIPVAGNSVNSGATFSDPEPRIRVRIGRNTPRETYLADWVMVHEMVHLAIPQVPRHQNWFHEGAATYVEIVARAQAGLSSGEGGWTELRRKVEQGMPAPGDRGLDHTPTWGRIYWGGAMFCMLADIEMRKRSGNRRGLQDALRGLVAAGGNYGVEWPLERTLATADAATGMTVLADLHARMKDSAAPPDLAALWKELGIVESGGAIVFRDDAPLSAIRRAIVAAPKASGHAHHRGEKISYDL